MLVLPHLKHGSLCTRASGMSCSCGRQGRPSRSNPNTRHARLECGPDRQHSISVPPRSPSVPGAIPSSRRISNYPGCRGGGWHLGPDASSAVWPGARCRSQMCQLQHVGDLPARVPFLDSPAFAQPRGWGQGQEEVRLVRASPRWQQEQGKHGPRPTCGRLWHHQSSTYDICLTACASTWRYKLLSERVQDTMEGPAYMQ